MKLEHELISPHDESFKDHYENILISNSLVDDVDLTDCPFIPVMDKPISLDE